MDRLLEDREERTKRREGGEEAGKLVMIGDCLFKRVVGGQVGIPVEKAFIIESIHKLECYQKC